MKWKLCWHRWFFDYVLAAWTCEKCGKVQDEEWL